MIPPAGGIAISATSGVPISTQVALTISGLPTAGPSAIANGSISYEGVMLDVTSANSVVSVPGQWEFDPTANTFTFESSLTLAALGTTLQIFPPMLVYMST